MNVHSENMQRICRICFEFLGKDKYVLSTAHYPEREIVSEMAPDWDTVLAIDRVTITRKGDKKSLFLVAQAKNRKCTELSVYMSPVKYFKPNHQVKQNFTA